MLPLTRRLLASALRTNVKRLTWLAKVLGEDRAQFYTRTRIPKGRGRYRTVYKVAPILKHLHSSIKRLLETKVPATGTSYAYETGVRLSDTAQRMQAHSLLVSVDFKDHFTSVSMWQVTKMLEYHGASKEVAFLLARLCCITEGGRSFLPQGSVVSPLLSNRVSEHLLDAGLKEAFPEAVITRYSDNVYLGFDSNTVRGKEVVSKVKTLTTQLTGWRCHKCKVMPYYRQQRGLGLTLNTKPNMPKTKYLALKALLHNLAHKDPVLELSRYNTTYGLEVETLPELLDTLRSQLAYWKQFLSGARASVLEKTLLLAEKRCIEQQQD